MYSSGRSSPQGGKGGDGSMFASDRGSCPVPAAGTGTGMVC